MGLLGLAKKGGEGAGKSRWGRGCKRTAIGKGKGLPIALYHLEPYMLFSEWLFTPAGLEPVLKVRPLFREFLAQIGITGEPGKPP